MRKFDNKVQNLKYSVLKEVTEKTKEDSLLENVMSIPETIIPGRQSTMRCCVYKERAILGERVKLAMGGDKNNANVIEVIDIACDECPTGGWQVTDNCRGCIAHQCHEACPVDAIVFDHEQKAHIDKEKCIECGKCAKVCPFTAIISRKRPCENSCKVKAISMDANNVALIDNEKCTQCGACVYQCPFGAISDKSFTLDILDIIKKSENNTKYKVYAAVAPSIYSQFTYAKLGQVLSGLKKLGFYAVEEVALGADIVANDESRELAEKGFVMSSCCPAFVNLVEQDFPELSDKISHNLSPMGALGRYIKSKDKDAKVIFIGPCTAKKGEAQKESIKPYIDGVLTFEELQAIFDGSDIDIATLPEDTLNNASNFGRIFARSGGLTEAVRQGLKENGFEDFDFKPISCNGIEDCRKALLRAKSGKMDFNFIEGMACVGGCVGGAGCINRGGDKAMLQINKYGEQSEAQTISAALERL